MGSESEEVRLAWARVASSLEAQAKLIEKSHQRAFYWQVTIAGLLVGLLLFTAAALYSVHSGVSAMNSMMMAAIEAQAKFIKDSAASQARFQDSVKAAEVALRTAHRHGRNQESEDEH